VIVLLKAVLVNVTALITNPVGGQPQGGLAPGFRSDTNLRANGGQAQNRPDPANMPLPNPVEPGEMPIEEIEAVRSREITAKAVSAILLIILKWFKVSRNYLGLMFLFPTNVSRYLKVRILYSASPRFQLSSIGFEALCPSGNRQSC
jgi:hypothetical protein